MVKMKDLRLPDGRLALLVARENGISQGAFVSRLNNGCPLDEAVSRPMVLKGSRHQPAKVRHGSRS